MRGYCGPPVRSALKFNAVLRLSEELAQNKVWTDLGLVAVIASLGVPESIETQCVVASSCYHY